MSLASTATKVETLEVSKSKGRNKIGTEEEIGCWVKLTCRGCMPSRSKVDSSKSGTTSTSCVEVISRNEKSRDQEGSSTTTTTSNAGSSLSTVTPNFSEELKLVTPNFSEELKFASQLRKFTFNDLKLATRNFRPESLLGEGGFGCVFKGWIEENGTAPVKPGTGLMVAVKILNHSGLQGHKEWLAEIDFLGHLLHPNLVKLIGFCIEEDQRLLAYEFMPRGSLENHLFRKGCLVLPWSIRMKIALGAAKGLVFLHEEVQRPIIYRDFKTSNILIDSDYNAKLSDFGLAKDAPEGDNTHVSTRVMGTYGYAAPEYVMTGHLTSKNDVYSFGVVLLEILSGRRSMDKNRPNGEQNLVTWARPLFGDQRRFYRLLDPHLEGHFSIKGAQRAIQVAALCLSRDPKARPMMSEVVEALKPLPNLKDMASSSYYFQSMQAARSRSTSNAKSGNRIQAAFVPRNGQSVRSLSSSNFGKPSPQHKPTQSSSSRE